MDNIKEQILNFKTKNKEGFSQSEIEALLIVFPDINKNKFNNALNDITCLQKNDETIIYHFDIEKAVRCGLENRKLVDYE